MAQGLASRITLHDVDCQLARSTAVALSSIKGVNVTSRLVWFLHFHKAGGSSLVELARRNGETFYPRSANGNPMSPDGKTIRLWELGPEGLETFVQEARDAGVSFVASEWGVPDLAVLSGIPQLVTVTVLRDPVARLLSNFAFDYAHGFTQARSLREYRNHHTALYTLDNYYCRQVLGSAWVEDGDPHALLETAGSRLARVDHVALLEGAYPFEGIREALGWQVDGPHQNSSIGQAERMKRSLRMAGRGRLDLASRALRSRIEA